jgi:ectoine hydroxylase-related dioxygenase (phytanoyl-CoA dioxygenase family)
MHFWPGSQHQGIRKHGLPLPPSATAHIYYSVLEEPPAQEVVAVPLQPGDALLFDVSVVHGTPPNVTAHPRWALQMQYASSFSKVTHCPSAANEHASAGLQVVRAVGPVFDAAGVWL